jgi:hypothetical protein
MTPKAQAVEEKDTYLDFINLKNFFFFAVLELELRVYALSHSTSPFL